MLERMSELGVRLAMDDFGTGYSSLSYLKRYPFDVLKIDRSFVRDLSHDADDKALVAAAIHMGQALGLQVVAEGVETSTQLDELRAMGCDLAQGYLFGTPMAADAFAARWLGSERRRSELETVVMDQQRVA
jgi:EAL domain-containing protein (putative c-di-GMP-specific phosphodiesterase class I)